VEELISVIVDECGSLEEEVVKGVEEEVKVDTNVDVLVVVIICPQVYLMKAYFLGLTLQAKESPPTVILQLNFPLQFVKIAVAFSRQSFSLKEMKGLKI